MKRYITFRTFAESETMIFFKNMINLRKKKHKQLKETYSKSRSSGHQVDGSPLDFSTVGVVL